MKLKDIFLSAIAVLGIVTSAFAKSNAAKNTDNNVSSGTEQVSEHDLKAYGSNYSDRDKFDGLTRKVGFDRMIPPHALEVCFEKRLTSSSPSTMHLPLFGFVNTYS